MEASGDPQLIAYSLVGASQEKADTLLTGQCKKSGSGLGVVLAQVSDDGRIATTGKLLCQHEFLGVLNFGFECFNNAETDPLISCIASNIVERCDRECSVAQTLSVRKVGR